MTILAGLLLLLCMVTEGKQKNTMEKEVLAFHVQSDGADVRILCWKKEGACFVFLPSYAELKKTTIEVNNNTKVSLDGIVLTDGMDCGRFDWNTGYQLCVEDQAPCTIQFVKSGNVATLYVSTTNGTMDEIHQDKMHKERARLILLTPDGKENYHTLREDRIRGHGNSTWELEKKSYNLYLGTEASLLDMGAAKKYVLISNAIDDTNLRNRLVYNFARTVGGYDGFSPRCEYVDLYLNGNYSGLYLLCEKPEIAENRLDAPGDSILLELTAYGSGVSNAAFKLNNGLYIEIHYPDPCSTAQKNLLEARIWELQEALRSDADISGTTGRHWTECIDLDSWARKYLIEEIFENADAGFYSQFYWWEPSTDRIYAGPCWDYDGTMGMFEYLPNCFLAQRTHLNPTLYNPINAELWKKEVFRNYVTEIYRKEFLPELEQLMNKTIPEEADRIRAASEMNRIRWFDATEELSDSIQEMSEYLGAHISFLTSAWLERIPYDTVTLKRSPGSLYLYFCVPEGTSGTELPEPEALGGEGSEWYLEESGELFDRNSVIDKDLILTAFAPNPERQTGEGEEFS